MTKEVALVACRQYDVEQIEKALLRGFELLGGVKKFVKKGQTVALKANLLGKAAPEQAVTTHPAVVQAVANILKKAGADCFVVDSAGGVFTAGFMGAIYRACGMQELADKNGLKLNDNYQFVERDFPKGRVGKKLMLLDALEKADVIFNLSKLKTHGFTGYSNAVKNMFGAIPGLAKVEMHGKFRTLDVFNDFLLDIHDYYGAKLALHITDAIVGMEGPGPTHGTPREIGALILSSNPISADSVGCRLINVDPCKMPTIQRGILAGYAESENDFVLLGESLESLAVKGFKTIMPDNYRPFASNVPKFLQAPINRWTTQRPSIKRKQCKGCTKCADHCPVKAIEMKDGKDKKRYAKIDLEKCIRCYCCQELCPFGVVKIKSGWLYRFIKLKKSKKNSADEQK